MQPISEKLKKFSRKPLLCDPPRRFGLIRKFTREEDGVLLIFGVYVFIILLMMGGIGIDLMRVERDRAKLQNTLDRAVLAAADLDQTLDSEAVVRDYFETSGLSESLVSVAVDEGLGYRVVSANASATIDTQFMRMTGVETLEAPASSTAEERISGVEISLVLDVSGSMNSNSRLSNLKIAARDFIDNIMTNSEPGSVSISIIPYATQVSAPDYFFNELAVSQEHNYSRCINFQAADFNTSGIDINTEYQRAMHFDPWNRFDGRDNDPVGLVQRPVCEDDAGREMVILKDDIATLKNFVTNLQAGGNTSIDLGMKWGTALLDPSLQTPIANLITAGYVHADFSQRPHEYDQGETIKVIVLMTDGQNTSQYYLEDEYRDGDSNIWWNDEQEVYSVYVGLDDDDQDGDEITEEPLFYWPLDDGWHDHAYGEGTYEDTTSERVCGSYKRNGSCNRYKTVQTTVVVDEPGSAKIVSYPDLWAYTTLKSNVDDHYKPWMGTSAANSDWYDTVRSYVDSTTKNTRTRTICDAAKAKSIVVYTIGFEAPSAGQTVLENCASSVSHYFDVTGLEIVDAFSAIASSIRMLKLTQ